jgi:sec-independent protein translocase protein TatB
MPSFQDSAVIFFLALLLFGPKKLPELARYVGKLMGEFRRASAEFRMQMEDEFRLAEQAEKQKKIAAMEAAAPVTPPVEPIPEPEHPHLPPPMEAAAEPAPEPASEPIPIASNGDLDLMPPATGLPVARGSSSSNLGGVFDSIPHASDAAATAPEAEAQAHG